MLSSDDWRAEVVSEGVVICPACGTPEPTMGACGVGAMSVHQEYICESCGHEFTAMFMVVGYRDGIGDT